jgi:hypothetical protein
LKLDAGFGVGTDKIEIEEFLIATAGGATWLGPIR